MRSTTPFVWIAVALVLLVSMIPGADVFAQQFTFDGTSIECIDNGGAPDTVDATNDSILVRMTVGCDIRYTDLLELTMKPSAGSGVIPYTPDTINCVTSGANFNGYRMHVDTLQLGRGLSGLHPDSARIVATVKLRLTNICVSPGHILSFEVGARGVWNAGGPLDKCGQDNVVAPLPCALCTEGCVLVMYTEVCGFANDGIVSIGDRLWLDSLETSNLLSPGIDTVEYFADFRWISGDHDDSLHAANDTIDVVYDSLENGLCGDTIWINRVRFNSGGTPIDTQMHVYGCVRPVDNVPPQLELGMIDSFMVINGNYIDNDTLVGCCDTLRLYMATDSNRIGSSWPFSDDVDGDQYLEACGGIEHTNFDISWIGVWLGDLVPTTDTSLYPHNSLDWGLLCPDDSLLWLSARWGVDHDPGAFNDLIYIDIPFCPEMWGNVDLQDCILDIIDDGRDLWIWAIDDAGNRSNRIGTDDGEGGSSLDETCFDIVPPEDELGSEIYAAGNCLPRFSPYDSTDFAHYRTNLAPDSVVWAKDRVDTAYTDMFNDVYLIGFDVRAMPEDTAPLVRLDWIHPHPNAPIIDSTLDTLRWEWDPLSFAPGEGTALFRWWGKMGTDSIDPVLSSVQSFWKCSMGGGLTVGITWARWMDAAGCNRILGSDYDYSTDLDDEYTTRNVLRTVLDMCAPGYTSAPDTFKCTNLVLGSGVPYSGRPTYQWNGPNGDPLVDNPILRFRPQRNFAQNPFDPCLTEDTLFYRVRVDTVDLVGGIVTWPLAGDSVRWYSAADANNGVGNPATLWTRITFNQGDINGPVVEFTWGHLFGGANDFLPDGLYRLTLELKDDAGNVALDSIYMWLNGAGPVVDTLRVTNMDTVCTLNYYTGYTQDTVAVWLQSDTTADAILIDWTCVYNCPPDRDTTWATLVSNDGVHKTWFGYLIIDSSMVSPFATDNSYEVAPWDPSCTDIAGEDHGNRLINVRAFDFYGADTLYSEPNPTHLCDRAIIGISPCARLIGIDQYFYYADPDSPQTLSFGHEMDEWGAISPGKIDSTGGSGTYNALTNWANDQVQDSIFLRLLIDSASVNADTLDTLVVQFVNPNIYPPETEPRIRELRKALFRPTSASLAPDPSILNTIYHGFLERDDADERFIEFRYYWNATWFIDPGLDSIMLVPYNQQDTIIVRAFMIAGDSILSIVGNDTNYLVCDTIFIDSLDIDNINPDFQSGWTGVAAGRHPVTGSTPTVLNLGYGSDCGFRFGDGERFRLQVKMTEPLHFDPAGYPNDLGSHPDGSGFWPIYAGDSPYRGAWQLSAIDLRTGELFAFGPNAGDSCVTWIDSVLVDTVSNTEVNYILAGHFDFPAAAAAWFATNGPAVDSVCLVIRSAWDQAGNPGRYNNPVFNDGLRWDSSEDTTFCVILQTSDPWAAGCPLVWGRPDSVLGWIAAEEDSVIVKATIIETPEIAICPGGTLADSAQVVEGNFQSITDDPNPWVLPNLVGPWFIYVDPVTFDTLGWARQYTWYLRADSADLAQIHCDGDYLPFELHLLTYGGLNSYSGSRFDSCVQVDVNEPLWADPYYVVDTSLVNIDECIPARAPFYIAKAFSDDQIDCPSGNGVGPDTTTINVYADLSYLLDNAAMDSVPPDSVVNTVPGLYFAWWYIDNLAPQFQCIDSATAWVKYYALTDSVGHYDRELFEIDTLYFCSDCVPPYVAAVNTFCACDSIFADFPSGIDDPEFCVQGDLRYVTMGAPVNFTVCIQDVDGDSSSGINLGSIVADLSSIDAALTGWTSPDYSDAYGSNDERSISMWGFAGCSEPPPGGGSNIVLANSYNNGDTIFVPFAFCDNDGNCDTVDVAIAIVDSLPPIVDFIYTIGDDSIRAYVTPADEHVHIWADINGYAADLLSEPKQVWADLSNFWCDSLHRAWYDTVYASYVEQIDPNTYRAYWGWYPSQYWSVWDDNNSFRIGDPVLGDSLVPGSDSLGTADTLCFCADLGAEGYYDTLWVHVADGACNVGTHFSVFELSGCDSTTPAVDSVWVIGNGCREGWVSSTPLDSHHVEVWAWMDTTFNAIADTARIDSMQANLASFGPMYAMTAWSADLEGGAPVYGYMPDSSLINGVLDTDGALLLPTYWEIENDGVRDRLVAKWVLLTVADLGCLDTVVVPVKSMRQTGQAGSHGYYIDVEYGWARVDTTRPVIYDMRVHSATTSINETTWVSPNVPLYVDVWAYDTNCDTITDHLGFDLTHPDGPFITFCNEAGFDTIWSWDTLSFDVLYTNADSLDKAWVLLRWTGMPIYNDTCNAIDLDNITGCIEAHLEDCLSNPAVPVQKSVTTDDRPPEFVYTVPWGDFTHVTGFPGDPDFDGIDSVLVLQNANYALDWDSVLTLFVVVDNAPGDTLISWDGTFINFAGFLNTPVQYPDEIFYNIDGNHRDSLVWIIPLYDGVGPLFNTNILSDRYWYPLVLSDSLTNNTGDPWDEQPDPSPTTLFCDDLDSVITFTIQNWNSPNPGMILLCDSNTVAGSDTDYVDMYNMDLWNNEFTSPDAEKQNLFKIYYAPGSWAWYSHQDVDQTRFYIFVEDTVLRSDGIDNDQDGTVDEYAEGVDFYTADLRVNGENNGPQVAHVDYMNLNGDSIPYLWFADNFDQQRYDISLYISDIYGHRDTLACGDWALQFFEDESCPVGHDLSFFMDDEVHAIRINDNFQNSYDLADISADDSLFVFADFDSISLFIQDPMFLIAGQPGSGPDLDTTTVDSINYNNGMASSIELIGPDGNPVAGFEQRYWDDASVFDAGVLTLVDPTDAALSTEPDGWYTIRVTLLDRVGNSCVREWSFRLDRTCPDIDQDLTFVTRPGQNTATDDLYTSWDYVEIVANVADSLDGVDSVFFEYCFDANRDGDLDAYPYWQVINVLTDEGGAWDTEYPFIAYWNIRNLPWSSEDSLGLPPVETDTCMNRYFVRVRAADIYGHECSYYWPVDITDDIAPLAYIERIGRPGWGWDFTPQGTLIPCYNPNESLADSMIYVYAYDYVEPGYDPNPLDPYNNFDSHWFDLAKGVFQYKKFSAPDVLSDDPYLGWTNMLTQGGQDTATYRNWFNERFIIQWNLIHPLDRTPLNSGQYNIRFVAIDVCDNADPLNTPVITVRLECDTTAPIAVISAPEVDARVTNWRCDEDAISMDTAWVFIQSTSAIYSDIDSVAFFFVDSLSVPGTGIVTFIGGDGSPMAAPSGFATLASTRWNTNNLLSGWYWLYAVAYDEGGLFDTDPIWQRVYVDNTMPTVEACYPTPEATYEGQMFELSAFASDPDHGSISNVLFQFLDRFGNWQDLPDSDTEYNWNGAYGADVYASDNPVNYPDGDGAYRIYVVFDDFGFSPLDSIRFRALATDMVDVGNNNLQGDYNRDCNIDRDLTCGEEVCCMAVKIYDQIPDSTNLWAFNHGRFQHSLPQFDDPTVGIVDGDRFSTCNDQNPLDTLLLVAKVHSAVEDGWLMHFKFWRSWPEGFETDTLYVPNDQSLNPTIPALGPIVLYHTWDSVYVIWTGARAYIEAADAADGLTYSQWSFSAQTEDLTGNVELLADRNTVDLTFACIPNAPITAASYVVNDVQNPENRVRITEDVPWNDFVSSDTIEVIYNRTTGPGTNDPEALVLLYTDASAIMNCRGDVIQPFNVQLWYQYFDSTLGRVCPTYIQEPFARADVGMGFDQFPPDDAMNDRYVVGLYLDNTFGPGVYNFAMVVRTDTVEYPSNPHAVFYDADWDNDGDIDANDSTRIDIVIRVVNVNEPQVTFCYPDYGNTCVHGTVPMSASLVDNPEFTGEIDTVWFQYFDGSQWLPIVDPVTGLSYDTEPGEGTVRMEFNEHEVPGMAGWYYDMAGQNTDNSMYSWYAERDLFPDVWVFVLGGGAYDMTRDETGLWTADVPYPYNVGQCTSYAFVIDANDNNILEGPNVDRWVADPRDACVSAQLNIPVFGMAPVSEMCACDYMINFPSRDFENSSYNFRTVIGWHDDVAYHVIENPSLGDSIHVFFVDNEPGEATHDIEFDVTRLAGGMLSPSNEVCNPADVLHFVTDIQPLGTHNLVVEDICKVIYQVSLTSNPQMDNSWVNTDTVYSNNDMGWTEAWPSSWTAINPLADNVDNDGDGLVDETHDVQAGDMVGEENVKLWSRSIVVDYCGNTYISEPESLWVDVSAPEACITQVGDVAPADNQVIIIPADRDLMIVATDQSYADPGITAVFQYRELNPIGPWTNIEADDLSNDTVRHVGNTFTAVWDLYKYQWKDSLMGVWHDPEGWFQLRAIAKDTVDNGDDCDNVICQITVRLNDIQPAARVSIYQIWDASTNGANSCTDPDIYYIQPNPPYAVKAIFAPTNIDTGLASLTFQYRSLFVEGDPSEWRNLETIWEPIVHGLNGDTTDWVTFQPRPDEIGNHGFDLRVIVEDYNGNDTSNVVTLYVDGTAPDGTGEAGPSIAVTGPCGDRCRLDITEGSAIVTAEFLPDEISGEINVDNVWLVVEREDGLYHHDFAYLSREGEDTWIFNFDGDLCQAWLDADLDMGCYYFWLYYNDCAGNMDSMAVTTTCGEGEATDLICVDCVPELPILSTLDNMTYYAWDCADEGWEYTTDNVLDGTTEIGGTNEAGVEICGHIPAYQQYINKVWLFVESADAGVDSMLVDTYEWVDTRTSSVDTGYCFIWNVGELDDEDNFIYPSGYYRVWVLATDAICQLQSGEMVDEFWVHVDNTAPIATITGINGHAPNAMGPDTFEVFTGTDDPGFMWVDWADGLIPDDSTQTGNQVQLWAKNHLHPSEGDTVWHMVGYVPSPCNPHFIQWSGEFNCNITIDVVAVIVDRWGNGDLSIDAAREAFAAGRYVDLYIMDTTPPETELWSIGMSSTPSDPDETVMVDQQNHIARLTSNFWDQDVYLHVFNAVVDESIERVYFQYSLDGTTWFDIAMDDNASVPGSCTAWPEPLPWWCERTSDQILWSALWDISGLRGHVWVRTWAEDICGNVEEPTVVEVMIDVEAPMAKVFAWPSDVTVDNLPCPEWNEPQIADSVERYTTLTLGACPDSTGTVHYDAYGASWFIKRAGDNPLDDVWCYVGDDSTGPFSVRPVNFWDGADSIDCIEPQPGEWYDIAVRMTDQNGHEVPWVQFMWYGQGITWQEKWQDLIDRGYVKRFKAVDHVAPVAHSLTVTPDCTPDSSFIYVGGNVQIAATVDDPDVVALTFAVRELNAEGPWTIIERIEGDSNTTFGPAEGYWNTELLNGTYVIGAFAEDYYGNMDGDLNVADQWPTNTLIVNVDNQAPTAIIQSVWLTDDPNHTPVTVLERGAEHTFQIEASDNFSLRKVRFWYRPSGGDPDNWTRVGGDYNWPFSFNWTIPTDFVPGWSYDFIAAGVDYCEQTDFMDAQGNYMVDWTAMIVDNEADITLFTIGGQNAETTPHVNGTNVCLVAHSDPTLDYVRFLFISGDDTTTIATMGPTLGATTWTYCSWDVTTLPEGPAQLCAVGSADLAGEIVTRAVDCRNIVIDHSLPYNVAGRMPASHGLLNGNNCVYGITGGDHPNDLWIQFNPQLTDASIDSVWFEWKWAADPDAEQYWHAIGLGVQDNGLTGRWAYPFSWYPPVDCGLLTLRARVEDNAVPESNEAFIIFADSVRWDDMPPEVNITNINGDVTPVGTEIPWGQVANIVATVTDPFCNGGNSAIDSVAFYYYEGLAGLNTSEELDTLEMLTDWNFIGGVGTSAPWQVMWNTSTVDPGEYNIMAIAWDLAGNCASYVCNINVVDRLYQRAWIIGYDADNDPGCDDRLWAITDDCPPNYTTRVHFEYSTNNGSTWISLGDATEAEPWCDDALDYNMWDMELNFDNVPAGAIYRAVAYDEENNFDPTPPRFQFADVTPSAEAVIYHEDLVRLHAAQGQVPWVSSMLEQAPPDENCFTQKGLVCVTPVAGDPTGYAGLLAENTRPCNLDNRDGKITVYSAVAVTRGDNTYMLLTKYEMNIHQVDFDHGSNGWLTSEDNILNMYVPVDGVEGAGTAWFQPAADDDQVNMLPPNQYYYTMISPVEYVLTEDIYAGQHETRFRMAFDETMLPEDVEPWNVVATYYDRETDTWSELGIIYQERDLENGLIEFHYPYYYGWDVSNDQSVDSGSTICPNKIALTIMYSTVRPLDEWVRFSDYYCEQTPDCTYYTPDRGPTVPCDVTFWAVLRQGEYVPPEHTIDVYLDGIRIINGGTPDTENGIDRQGAPLWYTTYDQVSGIYTVEFSYDSYQQAPWYGCLQQGPHTVQFFTNNLHTHVTPFYVDNTEPEAWTYPEYINHQVNLWANLTDAQSGVDTTSAYAVISDCTPDAFSLRALIEVDTLWFRRYDSDSGFTDSLIAVIDSFTIGFEVIINDPDRAFVIESEAMTFTPIESGYRAEFSMQWEQLQNWLIENHNAGMMCVTWQFHNNMCHWNDSTTYVYTIDVEPPTVIPVLPIGPGIDDDGDGLVNEDWRDCVNNDNDWWWDAEFAHWQERIDEDPYNFEFDTLMFGERPPIRAIANDIACCGSGASGVNVPAIWVMIDEDLYTADDTSNAALNFHILWPYGQQDDAFITFGGSDNEALNRYYEPGDHYITVAAPDSAGNVGQVTWQYYILSSGPAIAFDDSLRECGVFFNPEVPNQFSFCVDATANAPIAPNGIDYEVRYVPSGERISGPTTINPANTMHHCVNYLLSGSFPDGQSGIEIIVTARNIHANTAVDPINGVNTSSITFWADNLEPHFTSYLPVEGETFTRDEAIVIEVFYSDDGPSTLLNNDNGRGDVLKSSTKGASDAGKAKAEVRVGRLDENGVIVPVSKSVIDLPNTRSDRNGGATLDDNGSGIDATSFRMTIVKPNGELIRPSVEDFVELDRAHAKYVLAAGQMAGRWTVNVRVEDCVENIAATAWNFYIVSSAPMVNFLPIEGECQYENFWNPNTPLKLSATIREVDGVNTNADGISVDLIRVYGCETGLCTDTIVHDAAYDFVGELPDPANTGQTFTIEGEYNLNNIGPSVELRVIITATNMQGVSAVRIQPWIVDGTAPWITVVSPTPNTVVPEAELVTISANFGDMMSGLAAAAPGTRRGTDIPAVTSKLGPQRLDETAVSSKLATAKSNLGSWDRVVNNGLDDLDGNSGVDPACIELILVSRSGDETRNLTEAATITANNIAWIGELAAGEYTAILSVCDHVCNTNSVNWDFEVGRADTIAPLIELLQPMPYDTISAPENKPVFDLRFTEVGGSVLDEESIHVYVKTANGDPVAATMDVNMDELGLTALVQLNVTESLANGHYILYADGADEVGNRADRNWTFVVYTEPVPPDAEIIDTESAYNYPNPFEYGQETRFVVPVTEGVGAYVQIKIYDFSGQFVATVYDGPLTNGELIWTGRNESGETVANGVYLAHVITKAGGKTKDEIVKVAFKNKK